MRIRKAAARDFKELKEIITEMYLFEIKLDHQIDPGYIKTGLPESIARNIRSKNVNYFIAENSKGLMGYAWAQIEKSNPDLKLNKQGHIYHLYVRKEYRKKGIAEKLVKASFKWFLKRRVYWHKITIYSNNPFVKNYYEKYGFKPYILEYRKIVK